ncbi:MAG: tetratricopeptide repeat protein [Acidobacteriota bacterium]|nr:tetratricopeptide repeat protein [Acidobacteriota bacterium]
MMAETQHLSYSEEIHQVNFSDESIRQELARILGSRTFKRAGAQKRFLQYAVEQTVTSKSHELKEYTLGVQVFRRGAAFDPRLDPIVRVEARNLRFRLAKYYETEGEHDPLRIELPPRGYVPEFREAIPPDSTTQTQPATDASAASGPQDGSTEVALLPPPDPAIRSGGPMAAGVDLGLVVRSSSLRNARLFQALFVLAIGAAAVILLRGRNAADIAPSIAVLPFQNVGDVKDESFSDGLTDELIHSLGRVGGLRVVGRTSAFQFRGKRIDVREIGKQLGVATVLEGGVQIHGDNLRVTVELVDTTNGYSLWSSNYERRLEDALFLQRDISQAVVERFEEKLTFSPDQVRPVNAEAYREYLRGLYFWNKQSGDSIEMARHYFEHAIALDPGYAPAYTALGRYYAQLPEFTRTRAREVVSKVRDLATQALQLDNRLPEAHTDLAIAYFMEYKWSAAEGEFRKALQLGPGDAMVHSWYSSYLKGAGRLEEALAESRTAQALDPVSTKMQNRTAHALYLLHRYDEAIEQYKAALALDPQYSAAHMGLGIIFTEQGRYRQAINELRLAEVGLGNSPTPQSDVALAYCAMGETSAARNILQIFLAQAQAGSFPAKPIAKIYVGLGQKDQAFEWLGKAIEARDLYLDLKADPMWDPLRSDPRFTVLLKSAQLM